MKCTVKPEDFKGKSLLIATPCYGGKAEVQYVMSLTQLAVILTKFNIPHDIYLMGNESLVTRARNNCVVNFMANYNFTHMIFLDADGEFDPMDVLKFLHSDEEILVAPVPKKQLPIQYASCIIKDELGKPVTYKDKFVEVFYAGTAFMMIKREVFQKMFHHYKDLKYKPNEKLFPSTSLEKLEDSCYALFDTTLSEGKDGSRIYLSEDYTFSERWRQIGGRIFMDPTIKINHIGQFPFEGDLSKL